jgi:hypothetical protein
MRGAAKTVAYFDSNDIIRKKGLYLERIERNGKPGPTPRDTLFLVGTWDAWGGFKEMTLKDDAYEAVITIGETLSEQFHIVIDQDANQAIHPTVPMASSEATIEGPTMGHDDKHWTINGSRDQVHVGATFRVTFKWAFNWERGESMKISWEPVEKDPELKALEFAHEYSIVGTWTSWKLRGMVLQSDGTYTTSTRIGQSGREAYQIVRDRDWNQVIHPALADCRKTAVPVRGHDANGSGKNWLLEGPPTSTATITLSVRAGSIEVSHRIDGKGARKWKSIDKDNWHDYYVAGSWNNWSCSAMDFDGRNTHRHRVVVGRNLCEDFVVVMDKDWQQVLQPGEDGHVWCGPPTGEESSCWRIEGLEGVEYEIVLVSKAGTWTVEWRVV